MGKLESKINLYRMLLCQLDAGVPLLKALRSTGKSRAGRVAALLSDEIEKSGGSLCEVMKEYPAFFSEYELRLIAAAEQRGRLEDSFRKLAELFEKRKKLRASLVSALAYPVLLYFAASLLLPFISYMLKGHSEKRMFSEIVLMLSIPFVIAGVPAILKKTGFRIPERLSFIIIAIPVTGNLIRLLNKADFFGIYGSSVESGIDAVKSVRMAASSCGNAYMRKHFLIMSRIMEKESCPFSEAVRSDSVTRNFFDDSDISVLESGEQSGRIPETAFMLSGKCEEAAGKRFEFLARFVPVVIYLGALLFIAWQIITLFSSLIRKTTELF